MFRISSESELLQAFRPIDRPEVQIPSDFNYPVEIKSTFSWIEPSGHRIYLVFKPLSADHQEGLPFGIVFRRDQGSGSSAQQHSDSGTGRSGTAQMCEWCHSVRGGNQVALLTATASSKRRVGIHLCRDLSCMERATRDPGVNDLPRFESDERRVHRIQERMSSFARRNLF